MRTLTLLIITTTLLFGCDTSSESSASRLKAEDLQGEWVLTQEIFNNKTTDCQEDAIKTVLALKENGYYMMYDDLSGSGIDERLGHIQTLYQGQYDLHGDTLNIYYTVSETDKNDEFKVKEQSATKLVLENTRNKRQMHYSKK